MSTSISKGSVGRAVIRYAERVGIDTIGRSHRGLPTTERWFPIQATRVAYLQPTTILALEYEDASISTRTAVLDYNGS
jgi:hypothetical protein